MALADQPVGHMGSGREVRADRVEVFEVHLGPFDEGTVTVLPARWCVCDRPILDGPFRFCSECRQVDLSTIGGTCR